jgi:hypothetical protein
MKLCHQKRKMYNLLCLKGSKLARIRKIIPDPDLDPQHWSTVMRSPAQYRILLHLITHLLFCPTACYANTVSVHLIHIYPANQ